MRAITTLVLALGLASSALAQTPPMPPLESKCRPLTPAEFAEEARKNPAYEVMQMFAKMKQREFICERCAYPGGPEQLICNLKCPGTPSC